ncbi:MAG: hypothetical protein AAGA95_00965 [Pseudomonadota bacterium]
MSERKFAGPRWRLVTTLLAAAVLSGCDLIPEELAAAADDPETLCKFALQPSFAYATYVKVNDQLAAGDDPEKIAHLDCFFDETDGRTAAELFAEFKGDIFNDDVLYGFLEQNFNELFTTSRDAGRNRNGGVFAWGSRNLGKTAVVAYKRTGQKRFLQLYVDYFNNIMTLRDEVLGIHDDHHGRIMSSWGVDGTYFGRRRGQGKWVGHITFFAAIMQPATSFARIVRNDPKLKEFEPFAEEVVSLYRRAYPEFDMDFKAVPDTIFRWYWRPLIGKFEATNHVHLLGESLLDMYVLTGDELYADRVRMFLRVFETSVMLDDDGLAAWTYFPYFQQERHIQKYIQERHSEVVWKGALTVPFVYQAVQDGFELNPATYAAITKTIREHIVANNDYSNNIHPKGSGSILDFSKKPGVRKSGPATSIVGFLTAAAEDPAIAKQIRTTIATRPDLFPKGWFTRAERTLTDQMPIGYAYMLETAP